MTLRIGINRPGHTFLHSFKQSDLNDINNMFSMNIIAEQKHLLEKKIIHLHVSMFYQPYLFSGIYEIPIEVNRIIMSFLKIHINFTLIMNPAIHFPFMPTKWNFETPSNSSQILTKCLQYALERENNQYQYVSYDGINNWSVTFTPDKMCLLLFTRLKKDLISILEFL